MTQQAIVSLAIRRSLWYASAVGRRLGDGLQPAALGGETMLRRRRHGEYRRINVEVGARSCLPPLYLTPASLLRNARAASCVGITAGEKLA